MTDATGDGLDARPRQLTDMDAIDVGAIDDFMEARPRVVRVGGRDVGIIRWRTTFYAIRNVCPHMGAPLCAGTVAARLVSDGPLESVGADAARPVIRCPWHGWSFDVRTGRSLFDATRFRVKSYLVAVVDGRVVVEIGRS